jgi:2-dehydropantoate 2-reductase
MGVLEVIMTITVYGSGAIGAIVGTCSFLSGEDVIFVDRVTEHVDHINKYGLLISDLKGKDVRINPRAVEPNELEEELGLVFLCVKSQDTRQAMEAMLPKIGLESIVVSLQNGLNEEIISEYIGSRRTIGCLVDWGGAYMGPGHIQYSGDAPMRIGTIDGSITDSLRHIRSVLENTNETTITPNITGYLWSKIIWGNSYISNALGTSTSVCMLENDRNRPILLALFRESTRVAHAGSVKLEPLIEHNFDPTALLHMNTKEALNKFVRMADSFRHLKTTHSGPWRDIAVRKRPTEVDYIIGHIVKKGMEYNVPTPLNSRLMELVKEVERGELDQHDDNLLQLENLL